MELHLRQRLASQMSRGDLILFTGAGFSLAAKNSRNENIPGVDGLRNLLWPIAFPGEALDEYSSMADIYDCAQRNAGNRTGDLLREWLTINVATVPDVYRKWFSMPWYRIYTLNVDDLDEAVQHRYTLPARITSISAIKDGVPRSNGDVFSVHLNGKVSQYPDMTFSAREYAERAATHDPWYFHLVSDLLSHPVVFVGTVLNEPLLWQHIELRRSRERGIRELRPGSYLVTPDVPAARRAMLEEFNIQLVQMGQEEFANEILSAMEREKQSGFTALTQRRAAGSAATLLQRVAELRLQKIEFPGEFLLGRDPTWLDIEQGNAVKRDFEDDLMNEIELSKARIVVITGTAGCGKSTTLMRLALRYQAMGKDVYWMDTDTELNIWQITNKVSEKMPQILMIDDADAFGTSIGPLLRNLATDNAEMTVIAAIRSHRFDKLQVEHYIKEHVHIVYGVPNLEDSDINLLLDALTEANRLGTLKALARSDQINVFRELCGRQLLVAMIQATSNERFEEKIDSECRELGPELGLIYSVVAVATSQRTYLTQHEIMLAISDSSNEALNRIRGLVRDKLLLESKDQLRLRHRVVADRALDYYRREGQLSSPIEGLIWTIATKTHQDTPRYAREAKLLARLMNHDFLISLTSDRQIPRRAYALIEKISGWNYHYYLQRGSFEVEEGDIDLAKNFLDQARAMAPEDHKVQTEWAYMTLKRAALNADAPASAVEVAEAFQELEDAIEKRGKDDSYAYHVLGSQGLSWARRAPITKEEQRMLLQRLIKTVTEGVRYHPGAKELAQLASDLRKEYLLTAVQ